MEGIEQTNSSAKSWPARLSDSEESSSSEESGRDSHRRARYQAARRDFTSEGTDQLASLKLAFQFLSRNENKWAGPSDNNFTTEEYTHRFDYVMTLFGVKLKGRIRINRVPLSYGPAGSIPKRHRIPNPNPDAEEPLCSLPLTEGQDVSVLHR